MESVPATESRGHGIGTTCSAPPPDQSLQPISIDVEPTSILENETAALVQANGGRIAGARARDKLHFGRSGASHARIDNAQAQPLHVLAERDRVGPLARMPRREEVLLVTQDKCGVPRTHERLRIRGGHARVPA